METFIGIVDGAVIGAAVSWFFALQSSEEIAKTHRQVVIVLRALEEADVIEPLGRNEAGEITGVQIHLRGMSAGTSHATGTLTVEPSTERPPA